jgi:putative CocE/NonD family hydrolase
MAGSAARAPAGKLPFRIRAMRRLSARGTPKPVCSVTVARGIAVPASDGVTLLTDHYIPLADGPRPTLLLRLPYGRGFPFDSLFGAQFAGQGFHVVMQSCRGTGGSGGVFEPFRHERADGQAAVAWLREQDWFSGALATFGPSYLGYVQWALATDPPPELRGMVVVHGPANPYPFFYPSGAFALENTLVGAMGMLAFDRGAAGLTKAVLRLQRHRRRVERTLPLIDAYPPALGGRAGFFEQWLTHPDPADPYWADLDLRSVLDSVTVPIALVGGWDDVVLDQTLAHYRALTDREHDVRLLVGPWTHTSAFDKGWPVVFPYVLHWLRAYLGEPTGEPQQPVRVYVGGGGQWRDLPSWPPPQVHTQSWYPDATGALSTEPPAQPGTSSLRYDPADPTPSAGGQVLSRPAGAVDNKQIEARADVLVFTSAPLDDAIEVLGPVRIQLPVRGSSPYFDIFARLCDVDPQGRSRNVCDGLRRHRAVPGSGEAAGADGGESTMTVAMSSAAHRFGAGHRLRLQVCGGAHPRFARNTGTSEPPATASRLVPVDIEIRHGTAASCVLSLPTMTAAPPPAVPGAHLAGGYGSPKT